MRGPWRDVAAIRAQFQAGTFLGVAIDRAHPLLLERLAAADAYLQQRFAGLSPDQIRRHLRVTPRFGVLRGGGSYHAKGWAIDINYDTNPWVGGQAADLPDRLGGRLSGLSPADRARRQELEAAQNRRNDEALAIIWRAAWLTGRGETYSTAEMTARRGTDTTEQIWAHATAVSSELHDYLAARADPARIEAWLAGAPTIPAMATRPLPRRPRHSHANQADPGGAFAAPLHEELRTATAAQWRAQIEDDYRTYASRGSNFERTGAGARTSMTVTDHHLELVRALRDAGGLAWGASDIEGEQAGDFMHFDTRTIAACASYMASHRGERG